MDPVINSQVQSPLVRTLTTVATKAGSFTHNIPDNVPPVSFNKQEISAYNSPSVAGNTYKYRIPQYGFLTKCYLKAKLTTTTNSVAPLALVTAGGQVIKSVSLKTHNKTIQTLYGDEIIARIMRSSGDDRNGAFQMMHGLDAATYSVGTWTGTDETNFLVPLDFACTKAPHVNFSTRFVEDLEVHVETNVQTEFLVTVGTSAPALDMQLVAHFHNFHDNTEQAIRNENYQPGVPATILQYDTFEESPIFPTAAGTQTFSIKSNNLAYGMTLVHYKKLQGSRWLEPTADFITSVELWGSGQRLWTATPLELQLADFQDYNLSTRSENTNGVGGRTLGTSEFTSFFFKFGFQNNELVNTGSIALQTINNPELRVTTVGTSLTVLKLYIHYHTMIRIDSDTGVITRSMDV